MTTTSEPIYARPYALPIEVADLALPAIMSDALAAALSEQRAARDAWLTADKAYRDLLTDDAREAVRKRDADEAARLLEQGMFDDPPTPHADEHERAIRAAARRAQASTTRLTEAELAFVQAADTAPAPAPSTASIAKARRAVEALRALADELDGPQQGRAFADALISEYGSRQPRLTRPLPPGPVAVAVDAIAAALDEAVE